MKNENIKENLKNLKNTVSKSNSITCSADDEDVKEKIKHKLEEIKIIKTNYEKLKQNSKQNYKPNKIKSEGLVTGTTATGNKQSFENKIETFLKNNDEKPKKKEISKKNLSIDANANILNNKKFDFTTKSKSIDFKDPSADNQIQCQAKKAMDSNSKLFSDCTNFLIKR